MLELLPEQIQHSVEERVHKSLRTYEAAVAKPDQLKRYVTRALQLGRADLAADIVEAKTTAEPDLRPGIILERIIHESQLTGVVFFHRGARAARAVGRVVIGEGAGFGTGFMISPRLMMTNNHVLPTAQSAAASVIEFDFAHDLHGKLMRRQTFRLQPRVFFRTNRKMDYTIVAVESLNAANQPVAQRGWLHLIPQSGKAIVGERLNIVQHPDAKPQMIALRENTLVGVDGFFLHYSTDTRPGSSGSPVMNDQFQLAALHHAGVPQRDNRGNILKRDGTRFQSGDDPAEIRWIANEGARISQIVGDLSSQQLDFKEQQLLAESFVEAPLEIASPDAIAASPNSKAGPDDHGGGQENRADGVVGTDGVARWNFQLTFGPNPATPAIGRDVACAPTLPPAGLGSPATAVSDTVSLPATREEEPYFDEASEANKAALYYNDLDLNAPPDEVFHTISQLLQDTHAEVFGYHTARHQHLYPLIDRHPDGSLRSVYSDQIVPEELIRAEIARFERAAEELAAREGLETTDLSDEQMDDIDLILESAGPFNCEHVVPQSWFAKKQPMKADLHHLFTCEPGCNSFRSNIPYWEFANDETEALQATQVAEALLEDLSQEGSRPACGIREGRKFEPEANKGAVARATLYFLLRYPGEVGDIKSGPQLELTKSRLEILLKWSHEDPPSLWEKHRNATIAKAQGNRNPLIDHPEWAKEINFNLGFG